MTTIIVRDITRNSIIAQGTLEDEVLLLEGAYYFPAEQVNRQHLVVTRRPYLCPYKGKMWWIDLNAGDEIIENVAWVYHEPPARYEYIRDKIGFAFGMRPGVSVEKRP